MSFLVNQVLGLIERSGPAIENALRTAIQEMNRRSPDNAQVFLEKWKRLNEIVVSELQRSPRGAVPAAPAARLAFLRSTDPNRQGARRKRTRRNRGGKW